RVPGGHEKTARVGILTDRLDDRSDLIDGAAAGRRPRTPLLAVNRTKITILVGPFVPDGDAVVVEILDVGVTGEKPQQFMDDRFQMQFLRGHQRKAVAEIEAHLMPEYG